MPNQWTKGERYSVRVLVKMTPEQHARALREVERRKRLGFPPERCTVVDVLRSGIPAAV